MEKINIAELLRDCPKGMELDCTTCNNVVTLVGVDKEGLFPIRVVSKSGFHHLLTCEGCVYADEDAKCVIFPKGKTTWEGFVPPCKFKDGDIVASSKGEYIFMLKKAHTYTDDDAYKVYNGTCYFGLALDSVFYSKEDEWYFNRLATEEEKQKLFQAVKDNGYKWNEETKTLEKLIEPKFKVGNKIKEINSNEDVVLITDITDDYYIVETEYCMKVAISMNIQNNYELVPNKFDITTLKPFESRVLVRDRNNDEWRGRFFSHYNNCSDRPYICIGIEGLFEYKQCIPYEGNEHLLGKTDDCDEFYKTWK